MSELTEFDIVVAADEAGGIGKGGELPWRLPGDTKFLKRITSETSDEAKRNAVVMGRKTWESIPPKYRPLKKRLNAVITRQPSYAIPDGVLCHNNIDSTLAAIAARDDVERTFILGGGQIYALAVHMPQCRRIYLTRVEGTFEADAHFPELGERFTLEHESERHEENGIGYRFQTWKRVGAD